MVDLYQFHQNSSGIRRTSWPSSLLAISFLHCQEPANVTVPRPLVNDQSAPAISIVLPVYNRADVIGRAVSSVLRQNFEQMELIVVDDCSRDDTVRKLRAFDDPRLKVIGLKQNVGGNAARNCGIREARAPLVTFLDSDDEFLPGRLDDSVRYFATHPKIDLLVDACIKRWPDEHRKRDFRRSNPELEGNEAVLAALFDRRLFKATPGITVRRHAAIRAGLFDEGLRRRQDYDFILRVAKVGQLACRDEASWIKMSSADAISANLDDALPAIFALWDRHPEHFGELNARTGMADDLARHFFKLMRAGEGGKLIRDARSVADRFGAAPVAKMVLRGLGSYSARKIRQRIFGKRLRFTQPPQGGQKDRARGPID